MRIGRWLIKSLVYLLESLVTQFNEVQLHFNKTLGLFQGSPFCIIKLQNSIDRIRQFITMASETEAFSLNGSNRNSLLNLDIQNTVKSLSKVQYV